MTIRISEKRAQCLKQLNLNTANDILMNFPTRYENIEFLPFEQWKQNSDIIVSATVIHMPKISFFKGNKCVVYFDALIDNLNFSISAFNQKWLLKLKPSQKITIIGKYQGSNKILATKINYQDINQQLGIKPVYQLKNLINDKWYRQLVDDILKENVEKVENYLPQSLIDKYGLLDRKEAIKQLHQPESLNKLTEAIKTMKYEEFFLFNLLMAYRKKLNKIENCNFSKKIDFNYLKKYINQIPFELTNSQKNVIREIIEDLQSNHQTNSLIQGDVGSGKTIVSFIAMLAVSSDKKQSCLMAPTDILARQHYNNFINFFPELKDQSILLTASVNDSEKKIILEKIKDGSVYFIFGTHALFQQAVIFNQLSLAVIDEQHRFGVNQRKALMLKGQYCDIIMMSATPIPRTLAVSIYGDLDVSTISDVYNSKKVIHSKLIKENGFYNIREEIEQLLQDNQMYVVCPLVDQSNGLSRNVLETYQKLRDYFSNRYKVALLHGQLSNDEKTKIISDFAKGDIDILVCTIIIEVGIDVKNANIMVIYDSNRFGLAQLHQLRGRVARGIKEGYCYFLTSDLSDDSINRLQFLCDNSDGFKISYYDMKTRGPGDLLGTKQSGLPAFKFGNLIEDNQLLIDSQKDSNVIIKEIEQYPSLLAYVNRYVSNDDFSVI